MTLSTVWQNAFLVLRIFVDSGKSSDKATFGSVDSK